MKAHVGFKSVVGACVLALGGSLISQLDAAQGRTVRPRFVSFAATARAADLEALATDNLRPSERAFLREAIENTQAGLRIAQLATSQATSSDLRNFAQKVVTDYGQIARSLDGLVRKKGVALALSMEAPTERFDRIAEKSGAEFDREFIRISAKTQEDAVKLFERALADAKDVEVRDFAGTYLPALRDHLNIVRDLKKAFE